jgi:hypothetical protein
LKGEEKEEEEEEEEEQKKRHIVAKLRVGAKKVYGVRFIGF